MEICKEILAAYQLICTIRVEAILITSRELEMIALLVMVNYLRTRNDNIIQITRHYINLIAEN